MALLARILNFIAAPVLNWLFTLLANRIQSYMEKRADEKRIAEANKAIKDRLNAAKTPEEKDAAIRDLINRL